jgi:hypothetical protein
MELSKLKGRRNYTGGRPWSLYLCNTLMLQHFLENGLTDGGEIVSVVRRPCFTAEEDSCYLFLLEVEPVLKNAMRLDGLDQLEEQC